MTKVARQTLSEARLKKDTRDSSRQTGVFDWVSRGKSLEANSNVRPRRMIIPDKTRLTDYLTVYFLLHLGFGITGTIRRIG